MIIVDADDPIIWSSFLWKSIEFNLELLYQILKLPNEGDQCYLSANDLLSTFGKSEEEVYIVITNTERKPKTATELKQSPRVTNKWFMRTSLLAEGTMILSILFKASFSIPSTINGV